MAYRSRDSLQPIEGAKRFPRRRLGLKGEFILAFAPTTVVFLVFAMVKVLTDQPLLFASLASSAFLIYLDPQHATNTVRTLSLSQMMAATIGVVTHLLFGVGYLSGGVAMILTIFLMIIVDSVHPPAVSTSLSFAFRAGDASNLMLFGLAVAIIVILIVLQHIVLWLLARLHQ
jgi:CBS-domain-containing membrane protein